MNRATVKLTRCKKFATKCRICGVARLITFFNVTLKFEMRGLSRKSHELEIKGCFFVQRVALVLLLIIYNFRYNFGDKYD
jgi:hypothetical protein